MLEPPGFDKNSQTAQKIDDLCAHFIAFEARLANIEQQMSQLWNAQSEHEDTELNSVPQRLDRVEALLFHADLDAFRAIDNCILKMRADSALGSKSHVDEFMQPVVTTGSDNALTSLECNCLVDEDETLFAFCDSCRTATCAASGWWHMVGTSEDLCEKCLSVLPTIERQKYTRVGNAENVSSAMWEDIATYDRLCVCCDSCRKTLRPGSTWRHVMGTDKDLCEDCVLSLSANEQEQFETISTVSGLRTDLHFYHRSGSRQQSDSES